MSVKYGSGFLNFFRRSHTILTGYLIGRWSAVSFLLGVGG